MAYKKRTYIFSDSKEIEYVHKGKYGAPGEKRASRRKRTPEDIKKANLTNRINRVRRKIKANFKENDYWMRLSYKVSERKPP